MTARTVHVLRAELARLERRGYVRRAGRIVDHGMRASVPVVRLRPLPNRAVRRAVAAVMVLALLAAFLVILWQLRVVVLAAAGVALGWLVLAVASGHKPGCPGLHCTGCRG